jgi:diaminohydroxyphosphoribosylaminopyrimidine deaminase/5-amino-6-(5-phosphoribosylamino)uracil reductase
VGSDPVRRPARRTLVDAPCIPGDPGVRDDANEGLPMIEHHQPAGHGQQHDWLGQQYDRHGHQWDDAMRRAIELAAHSPLPDPNPRVGCVILGPDGEVLGQGWHHGAGTPHAEVEALADAGALPAGCTAVVTLEPCNHTGRTGPCARALVDAGVSRVVIGQSDPNPVAAGGAGTLVDAGIEVIRGVLAEQAAALNPDWTFSMRHGRPRVVWKYAASLDGRSAAADGTSRWITSSQARVRTHRGRALCGAVMVGTGTGPGRRPQTHRSRRPGAPATAAGGGGGSAPAAGMSPARRLGADRADRRPRPGRGTR